MRLPIDVANLLPDPHSIGGSWLIVLGVILFVVLGALSLSWLAPIRPTPYTAVDEAATMVLPMTPITGKV